MFHFVHIVLALLLFSGCGKSSEAEKSATADVSSSQQQTSPEKRSGSLDQYVYEADPDKKAILIKELREIKKFHDSGPEEDDAKIMIHAATSLMRTLAVTAKALDKDEVFRQDIDREIQRFEKENLQRDDLAGKIMNGMVGIYSMYSTLGKMKFLGSPEGQEKIQSIHDSTVAKFHPDIQAIEGAARVAESCYKLSKLIMQEIDSEDLYSEAFLQIQSQFEKGLDVAMTPEDRYVNGMFRTFEVSQLWELFLDPPKRDNISDLNTSLQSMISGSDKIGTHMAIATEFLYRISYMIAVSTVQLTL